MNPLKYALSANRGFMYAHPRFSQLLEPGVDPNEMHVFDHGRFAALQRFGFCTIPEPAGRRNQRERKHFMDQRYTMGRPNDLQ